MEIILLNENLFSGIKEIHKDTKYKIISKEEGYLLSMYKKKPQEINQKQNTSEDLVSIHA